MHRLDRGNHVRCRQTRYVGQCKHLGVFDPVAQRFGFGSAQIAAQALKVSQHLTVACIANRVDVYLKTGPSGGTHLRIQLVIGLEQQAMAVRRIAIRFNQGRTPATQSAVGKELDRAQVVEATFAGVGAVRQHALRHHWIAATEHAFDPDLQLA